MKTLKVLSMAMLAMSITLVSCSGDDGEQGPQGIQGLPGTNGTNGTNGADGTDGDDGISCWDLNGNGTGDAEEDINNDGNFDGLDCQGTDGQDGQDGNANVQELEILLDVFANYSTLNFDLSNIIDSPENYAYLYYIDHQNGFRFSIPGHLYLNTHYARVYNDFPIGATNLYIGFYGVNDDAPYFIAGGVYDRVIVVAVEKSNLGNKAAQESLMAELKAAGVDIADYDAVAEYFNL